MSDVTSAWLAALKRIYQSAGQLSRDRKQGGNPVNDFALAWAAFKNMLRAAARDPLLPRLDRRGLLAKMPGYDLFIGRSRRDPEPALCARHFRDLAGKAATIGRRHARSPSPASA